jgi:hypothetical protein
MAGYFNEFANWVGDTFGGGAQAKAANAQIAAGDRATNLVNQYYGQAQGTQQDAANIGGKALSQLSQNVNNGSYSMPQSNFQAAPFNYQQSPGYEFQMQQGLEGVQNSAAARGSGLSGATMKALQRYGTGLAAQDYNNQFQNYIQGNNQQSNIYQQNYGNNANQNINRYNQMAGVANYGQQANNNLANMSMSQGNNLAGIVGQQGNAQAAGIVGKANAQATTIGNMLSYVPMAVGLATGDPMMAMGGSAMTGNMQSNTGAGGNFDYYNQTKQPYYNVY